MNNQQIIADLINRATEAEQAMIDSEADGNSDYDYHQGRYEAYSVVINLLENNN